LEHFCFNNKGVECPEIFVISLELTPSDQMCSALRQIRKLKMLIREKLVSNEKVKWRLGGGHDFPAVT
jgi:hypothetical protein